MKPNILHIINSSGLGGAETIIRDLIRVNKDQVFCLKKDKVERFSEVSNKIYFGTKSKFYKFNPLVLLRLVKIIKQKNIQILHVHLANSLFYAILAKFIYTKLKIIYHEHGEIFYNKYLNIFLRITQKKVDIFIAVSEATKKALMEKANIPQKKIVVLYNFVDLDRFNRKNIKINVEKEKAKLGIKKDEFVIGFVGRLAKVKGCEYLIKALPYLDFKYKVIIAGDGSEREYLESLAENLNVKDRVIFLGYVSKPELIYPLFNVLVVPSLSESFGLSVIEAQAMGIPVIASDINGLREIISSKNLFIKGKIRNISKLIKEEKRRTSKYIKSKEIISISKYSLDNYLVKLNNLYKELLKDD